MESKPSGKELFKIYENSIFGDKAYAIFEVDFDNARLYSTIDAIIENHWKGFRNRDYETKLELCLQTLTNSAYMYYIYDTGHVCPFNSVEGYIEFHDNLISVKGEMGILLKECSVSLYFEDSNFIVEKLQNN